MEDQSATERTEVQSAIAATHAKHCFVVMPFGRDTDEQRWFRGWYEAVIQPAVTSCGYETMLSASEDQPGAINDEIRAHLVFDPMVVVDLGGKTSVDPPNPNVMYELGIRHAFGLPLVVMAWEGQRLPFDVSNQRAILSRRDFLDIEPTRQKLARFIKAAEDDRYYNPMEAVGREATIETTSMLLGEDSLLAALAREVQELRVAVIANRTNAPPRWKKPQKIKVVLSKTKKAELWSVAQSLGFDASVWGRFLGSPLPPDMHAEMREWSVDEWSNFLSLRAREFRLREEPEEVRNLVPEELVEQVRMLLPDQPWPIGIHKEIADKTGLPTKTVSRSIQELIRQGIFYNQIDGNVIKPTITEVESVGQPLESDANDGSGSVAVGTASGGAGNVRPD